MFCSDANFDAAGCKAIYAQLDGNVNQYGEASDNLNVFCPDNADITIQVNDGTVQAITSFEYDGEVQSGPLTLTGNRVAFGTCTSGISCACLCFIYSLLLWTASQICCWCFLGAMLNCQVSEVLYRDVHEGSSFECDDEGMGGTIIIASADDRAAIGT